MNVKRTTNRIFKVIILTGLLCMFYAFDFFNFKILSEVYTAPGALILCALLHTAMLSYVIKRSGQHGWRLVSVLFLAFYGTNTLMVAIEAVYLPDALPPDVVLPLLVNGGIIALLFSFAAVLVWGRWQVSASTPATDENISVSWIRWIGRFTLIGIAWGFIFVVFGALVFLPLARALDPEALAAYTNLDMPAWVLPFQVVRGVLWAALTLPLVRIVSGPKWMRAFTIALLLAVLMGTNILRAPTLTTGLRIAHFVEVTGENFIFGGVLTWIFTRRHT